MNAGLKKIFGFKSLTKKSKQQKVSSTENTKADLKTIPSSKSVPVKDDDTVTESTTEDIDSEIFVDIQTAPSHHKLPKVPTLDFSSPLLKRELAPENLVSARVRVILAEALSKGLIVTRHCKCRPIIATPD